MHSLLLLSFLCLKVWCLTEEEVVVDVVITALLLISSFLSLFAAELPSMMQALE
jgi:hypothetical protein